MYHKKDLITLRRECPSMTQKEDVRGYEWCVIASRFASGAQHTFNIDFYKKYREEGTWNF